MSYGSDYFGREPGLERLRRFGTHWWAVRFYALIAERLLRGRTGARVLEIGCAFGHILARLETRFETWGIDLSEYAVERAREAAPRSRVFRGDVDGSLPEGIAEGGFDLVIAKYLLEHLPRPADTLGRIVSLMAPGGRLLYSVPDMTSPGRRLKGDQWFAFLDDTHLSLLEPSEWLAITRGAGLEVERTFSDGLWDVPYVSWLPRLAQYPVFSLPAIASVAMARPIVPAGWGENLIVIARRPPAAPGTRGSSPDPPRPGSS